MERSRTILSRRLHVAAAVTLAWLVAMIGFAIAPDGSADDRFVAGGRIAAPVRTVPGDLDPALRRAAVTGRALGLPDGRRSATRIRDRFAQVVIDEVTTLDGKGRPVAIQRFDPAGRLVLAVQLGWSSAPGRMSAQAAQVRAASVLTAVDLRASGPGRAEADRASHGWVVRWPRLVAGVPVPGDGTVVRLWPDGSVHSVSSAASVLAPVPVEIMDAQAARDRAADVVASWAKSAPVARVDDVHQAWVAPNDLFEPSRPDAPDAVRRLAWVADVTPVGPLASRMRAIQLYIDAGDGRLLGGDLLE